MKRIVGNILLVLLLIISMLFIFMNYTQNNYYETGTSLDGIDLTHLEKSDSVLVDTYEKLFYTTKIVFVYNGMEIDSSKSYISLDLNTTKDAFQEGRTNTIYLKIDREQLNDEIEGAISNISKLNFDDVKLANEIRNDLFTNDKVYLVYDLDDYVAVNEAQETYVKLASETIVWDHAEEIFYATNGSIVISPNNRYYLLDDIDSDDINSYDYSMLASMITKLTIKEDFSSYLKHNPYRLYDEVPSNLRNYWSYVSPAQNVGFSFYNNSDNIYIIRIARNGKTLSFSLFGPENDNNIEINTDTTRVYYKNIYGENTDYNVLIKDGSVIEVYRNYLNDDGYIYKTEYLYADYYRPVAERDLSIIGDD